MNFLFRILVAVYSFVCMIICGIIMISPFGEKHIMAIVLEYVGITFYQSNRYDVMVFVVGLVFFALNIAILTSGLKTKRSAKYLCTSNDSGVIKISANSIENIALALAKRFQGVKEAKAKVNFRKDEVEISVKLAVVPDVNVPSLCKSIQDRVKDSVQTYMELKVRDVSVSVEGVHAAQS